MPPVRDLNVAGSRDADDDADYGRERAAECPFCDRIERGSYETAFYDYDKLIAVAFQPLNPVTPGHRLYVPAEHVSDATIDPALTGRVMAEASHHTRNFYQVVSFNLITSVGSNATQTIRHLHIHAVPRRKDDGLHLPWTGQVTDA